MTVIAVTGHIDLTVGTIQLVRDTLVHTLSPYAATGLTGVSCIAEGADALFADSVLSLGGTLVAVIPSADYREAQVKPDYVDEFERLRQAATEVLVMPFAEANGEAYEAANEELLRRADRLIAVWDGQPGNGRGGTADAVAGAKAVGIPVEVVWPEGAARKG